MPKSIQTLYGNALSELAIISLHKKNKATSSQRSVEFENMAKKEEIIKQLAALDASGTTDETTSEQTRALMKEWNSIGHVPFKEKDRLYNEFHGLIDKLFDKLNISASEKKLSNFKSGLNKGDNLYRDRENWYVHTKG